MFMGQVSLVHLGQSTGPVLRFIVTDELGKRFIPGANVSIVFEDGTPIISKLADAGGNVAFGKREILNSAAKAGFAEGSGSRGVFWYTVEAPGYILQDGMLFDPMRDPTEQFPKLYTIALKKVQTEGLPTWAWVAGGVAAVGLIGWLALNG